MISTPTSKELKWLEACTSIANLFSTCTRRKYAAIILASNGRIAGLGYNGSAPDTIHCEDGGCPRSSMNVEHGSVYDNCTAIHAEANAIMWSDVAMRSGGTLIINGPPCYGCAKLIASSGIKTVVCRFDPEYAEFKKVMDYLMSINIEVKVSIDV